MDAKKLLKTVGIGLLGAALGLVLKILNTEDTSKYSDDWLESLSDEEFFEEREAVRKKARENGGDAEAEILLQRFNREEYRRAEAVGASCENPNPIHREHGRYLPNDD